MCQINIHEYLHRYKEESPTWLCDFVPGDKVKLQEIFNSRIAYYPGCGFDGNLITVVNKAHGAHVFLYVDYGISREKLDLHLQSPHCIRGYHILGQIEYSHEDFNEVCHYVPYKGIGQIIQNGGMHIDPYCLMTIFERNEDKNSGWGAKRFALIVLCADGIATYDYLFAKGSIHAPWIFMLQDHGYGGNYDKFGKGGLLDRIISMSNVRPRYVICAANTLIWNGYKKVKNLLPTHGGMLHHTRELYTYSGEET